MARDPYEVIGVKADASKEEISAAYKRAVVRVHPDRNPGDPDASKKLVELNDAYSILSDEGKKAAYDRVQAGPQRPSQQGHGFHVHVNGFDFHMWGEASPFRQVRIPPGKDVETEIRLSLKESVLGTTRTIRSKTGHEEVCRGCSGSRTAPGSRKTPCPSCAGTGSSFYPGRGGNQSPCRGCGGHGDIPLRKCTGCDGTGSVRSEKEVMVRIPSGVMEGHRLRLAGNGEASQAGGPPGDMYVDIKVDEDKDFVRRGSDLHTTVRVPFHVAAGRLPVRVVGIDGKEYRVDAGRIVPGITTAVVQGAGVPSISGPKGRLLATIQVDMPEPKTARGVLLMRELLEEMTGKRPPVPSPDDPPFEGEDFSDGL